MHNRLPAVVPKLAHPFVVLPENRLAVAAVELLQRRALSGERGLVFVSGPSGCGKSHLCAQFSRALAQHNVAAITFEPDRAAASPVIRNGNRFREICDALETGPSAAVFLCEDLHSVATSELVQRQLVLLIDGFLSREGVVLLTSNTTPGRSKGVSARLASRCHAGTCVTVALPGLASRITLLRQFTQHGHLPWSSDAVELLAERLACSPRELLAATRQVAAMAAARRSTRVDRTLAEEFLEHHSPGPELRIPRIAGAVARQFGISVDQLRSEGRQHGTLLPRQCAMFLARELTGEPLAAIGRYFGRPSHSTVAHAYGRIRDSLAANAHLRQMLLEICTSLGQPSFLRDRTTT